MFWVGEGLGSSHCVYPFLAQCWAFGSQLYRDDSHSLSLFEGCALGFFLVFGLGFGFPMASSDERILVLL